MVLTSLFDLDRGDMSGGVVAYVELYQGGGVTRSAAVIILLVTGVTVRRHLTSRSRAAVLILVVTGVTDCRRPLSWMMSLRSKIVSYRD